MPLKLRFLGSLRQACGKETFEVDYAGGSILDLVDKISKKTPELRRNLLDEHLQDPKPNALILVNGREISVLNGLSTKLKDRDEIVFVPVVHGG